MLRSSYEKFVQSFVVVKYIITLEDIMATLHTREIHRKVNESGVGKDNKTSDFFTREGKRQEKSRPESSQASSQLLQYFQ